MEKAVMVQGGLIGILDDAVAGVFAAGTVGLFIADADPGKTGVNGDFTPATFTGSTPVAITWGEKYLNAQGDPEISSQLIQFNWSAGILENVHGILIKSAGVGTPLLRYEKLDAPKQMATTNDSLGVVVRLTMSAQGFGISVQVTE